MLYNLDKLNGKRSSRYGKIMDEKTVRLIIAKYLSEIGARFTVQKEKEAGPDFLMNGLALETKGDSFDTKHALGQFTKYAFKYAGLQIALPIDALSINFLYSLYVLECIVKNKIPLRPRLIKMYLICKSNKNEYSIESFESIDALLNHIKEKISQEVSPALKSDETMMKDAIETGSDINKAIKKFLEREAISIGRKVVLEKES